MEEFLARFPEHPQFGAVKDHYNTLKNEREEQQFLKSLKGTLKQSPVVKLTLGTILNNENLSSEETITQLKHYVTIYDAGEKDQMVADCLTIARNKIERLERERKEQLKEHANTLAKTELEIRALMSVYRTIAEKDKQTAVKSLNALYEIHKQENDLSNVLREVVELRDQLSE